MSKQRISSRKKRIRQIKRVRRVILSGTAVSSITAVALISWAIFKSEPDITPKPIMFILPEPPTLKIHIEMEKPLTYQDVEFVPLPVPMTEPDQEIVFRICQENDVAFPLVMAIIEHESNFDGTARSKTGDSGYMQINDCNAERMSALGFSDLYNLEQNVGAGVHILKELFLKYDGDVAFVLMAYNAGERGAQNMRDSGIYETKYTVEILERAETFSSYIDNAEEKGTPVR